MWNLDLSVWRCLGYDDAFSSLYVDFPMLHISGCLLLLNEGYTASNITLPPVQMLKSGLLSSTKEDIVAFSPPVFPGQ